MNKKKKRLLWAGLLLLFLVVTGGLYAYWAGTVGNPNEANENPEITIGQGQDVNTELNVTKALKTAGKKLVPEGKVPLSVGGSQDNVDAFEATYTVRWAESGEDATISAKDLIEGNLVVSETHEIEGASNYADLVQVEITPSQQKMTAAGDPVTVTVKVTLKEPENKAAYDAIVGQTIKVNLNFTLAQ